jgi:bromodomain-containing factor 1
VDPIALNVPHYPIVIKRPMDFSTIETKLQNSNPNKTPEPLAPRYRITDDFVGDVRQIFQNCYLFNGPEHFISSQARRLEDILDKQLKQMPADEEVSPTCPRLMLVLTNLVLSH